MSEGVLAVGADSGGVLAVEASKRSDAADKSWGAPATDMLCKYAFNCGVPLLILIPRVEKSGVAVPPPTPPPLTALHPPPSLSSENGEVSSASNCFAINAPGVCVACAVLESESACGMTYVISATALH